MGFYPVNPVGGIYEIGTPIFPEVRMHLENGNTFIIKAKDVSEKNIYIKKATLNGKRYKKHHISHKDIINGSTLEFTMYNKE